MQNYDFWEQKEDEKVVLALRQHPLVFLISALEILVIILVYIMIFIYFQATWITSWATFLALALIIPIIIRTWFRWWNQVYLITSHRVIAVEQRGFFNRAVTESNLENILSINHEIKGPIRTIFNFGNVRIRASGVIEDELVFSNVGNPYEVQQEIVHAQKEKSGGSPADQKEKTKVVLR